MQQRRTTTNRTALGRIAFSVLAVMVGGCGNRSHIPDAGRAPDGGDLDAGCPFPAVTATVALNPNDVFGAIVTIQATGAISYNYLYGVFAPDDVFGFQSATYPLPSSGMATATVIGLMPDQLNHVSVTAYNACGNSTTAADQRFNTPSLADSGFPFPMNGVRSDLLVDDVLLGLDTGTQTHGLIIDRNLDLLWDRIADGGTARGLDFEMQSNGDFTIYRADEQEFEELDLASNVVRTWADPLATFGTDGHRLVMLPNGNALVLGRYEVTADLSDGGGSSDAGVYEVGIDEVAADGGVVFSWKSEGEVPLMDTSPAILDGPPPVDALRPMGMDVDTSGNIVVAFANIGSVLNIARPGGTVQWTLGGNGNQFSFPGDELNGPTVPLAVHMTSAGTLLLLDSVPAQLLTRAVEYSLDLTAMTATRIWEYRPGIYSTVGGSVERESDGSTLVAWGESGIVSQMNSDGGLIWSISVPFPTQALSATSAAQVLP